MRFTVQLLGSNFLVHLDDGNGLHPHALITQVEVEAENETVAGEAATQLLYKTQTLLDMIQNAHDNPPALYVAQVWKNESTPPLPLTTEPSLTWYLEV
jgi:hypothetical protein